MISLALLLAAALFEGPDPLRYPGRENQLKVAVPRLDESIDVDGRLAYPLCIGGARACPP